MFGLWVCALFSSSSSFSAYVHQLDTLIYSNITFSIHQKWVRMMAKEQKHYQHTRISNGNKSKSKFPIFFHNMQRRKSECLSNHKKTKRTQKNREQLKRRKERKNCLSYEITMLTIVVSGSPFVACYRARGYSSAIKTEMIFHSCSNCACMLVHLLLLSNIMLA